MKNELTKKLLAELLKDSKRSDRELAKVPGVSQPTVTRRRNQLVEEGIIRDYTVIPDFAKMGYSIMAVSTAKFSYGRMQEMADKAEQWMYSHPNIIFKSRAHGQGRNALMISLHRNYADYSKFINELLADWGTEMEDGQHPHRP